MYILCSGSSFQSIRLERRTVSSETEGYAVKLNFGQKLNRLFEYAGVFWGEYG